MKKMHYLKKHSPRLLGLLIMGFFILHLFCKDSDYFLQFIPLKCPLHLFLNIKCPLCGLGHAVLEANHQHFSLSLEYHVLGIGIYGYLLALALGLILLPQKIILLHQTIIDNFSAKTNFRDQ